MMPLLALVMLTALGTPQAQERPNVLLITVDALRADRIGAVRAGVPLTPTLDSLAQSGALFENAFTCAAWTSPALVSCLTGRHEPSHGVDTREKSLSPGVPTLASCLERAGFSPPDICYLIGSPNYQNLGFQPFPRKQEFLTAGHDIIFRWLDTYARDQEPFFLYYHYRDLHQPYDPSPPFDTLFVPGGRPPQDPAAYERFLAVKHALLLPEGKIAFEPSDAAWIEGLYDGQVAEADARFFRPLFDRLRRLGVADRTLVIVTADHGEELLDHGNVGHASTSLTATLYDEELRIPLILSWPARILPRRIADLVQLVDVMPTVLDLLDLPIPEGVQGRSLVPLLEGKQEPAVPVFVSSVLGGYQATTQMQEIRLRAVRTPRWKLVRRDERASSRRALFDLFLDPAEAHDVAAVFPHVADSLEGLLESWLAQCRTLYRRPVWRVDSLPFPVLVRPVVLTPQDGDTLDFVSCEGRLGVSVEPGPTSDLTIEYSVGVGPYHVEGFLPAGPQGVSYGPFTPTFWNTLVRYNPWSFRVMPPGRPDLATPWRTFWLRPCLE